MAMNVNPRLLNLATNSVINISKEKFSVGRSLKADYVLSDNTSMSRIHFFIEKKDGMWTIQDNSTNGTYLNKILLKSESRNLSQGDLIEFINGTVSFKFENPLEIVLSSANDSIPELIDLEMDESVVEIPSVSNDHSYDRQRVSEERTTPTEGAVAVDVAVSDSDTNHGRAPKRNKLEQQEGVPEKKNKAAEDLTDEPQLECILEASELECSICQELYIKAVTLNCAHSFCDTCIQRWKSQKNHCPICRRNIETVNPSMVLDNLVKKLELVMDEGTRERRNKMIAERPNEPIPLNRNNAVAPETYSLSSSDFSDLDAEEIDEEEEDDVYSWGSWGEYDGLFTEEYYDYY